MEIDWDYARKADLWEHEEACRYVCPKDAAARAKLDRLAKVAAHGKKLHYVPIRRRRPFPDSYAYKRPEFLAFAQSKGYVIPPELTSQASGEPLQGSERERDSLLKMVLGMAMSAYDYNPGSLKNSATGELKGSISADLNQRGLALDADTVRKFIKEAETRFKHLLRNPQKP